uniref:Carbonic anhydrase n=1 Tax=viral metagenome TaxID=1070528 RepID=A0A6C0CBR2_9ZZZZ
MSCKDKPFYQFVPRRATILVLSCIDYRLIDNTMKFLESACHTNNFDFTTLAGASLGFNQNKYGCWNQTFIQHVELAIQLHKINKIIVIDHMDCGAYKLFYPGIEDNSHEERSLHIENIKKFVDELKKIFPQLGYDGYIINLGGDVERISIG